MQINKIYFNEGYKAQNVQKHSKNAAGAQTSPFNASVSDSFYRTNKSNTIKQLSFKGNIVPIAIEAYEFPKIADNPRAEALRNMAQTELLKKFLGIYNIAQHSKLYDNLNDPQVKDAIIKYATDKTYRKTQDGQFIGKTYSIKKRFWSDTITAEFLNYDSDGNKYTIEYKNYGSRELFAKKDYEPYAITIETPSDTHKYYYYHNGDIGAIAEGYDDKKCRANMLYMPNLHGKSVIYKDCKISKDYSNEGQEIEHLPMSYPNYESRYIYNSVFNDKGKEKPGELVRIRSKRLELPILEKDGACWNQEYAKSGNDWRLEVGERWEHDPSDDTQKTPEEIEADWYDFYHRVY